MWTERFSGQHYRRGAHDHRDPYERDKTRVIHCPAFRRLQAKTQILGTNTGDFHRTRLTHSLEVASIACSIVRNLHYHPLSTQLTGLLPSDDLISTISLLHDIGHPPFGHGGENALNFMMRDHGGFESNGQTLRLLTKLEQSYGSYGLDLTRRTLLGILKYPVSRSKVIATLNPKLSISENQPVRINDWLPPKAYFTSEQPEVDWLLSPFSQNDRELFQSLQEIPRERHHGKAAYHSFDCSIMDTADDIAYGVHDLEDAIHLQLIIRDQVDTALLRDLLQNTGLADPRYVLFDQLFSTEIYQRKQAIGTLVNYLITSVQINITNNEFEDNLLKHNVILRPEAKILLDHLQQLIYQYVIDSPSARTAERNGQQIICRLFNAIRSNPDDLLDKKNLQLFQEATDERVLYRLICDSIANMTDDSARRLSETLCVEETCTPST